MEQITRRQMMQRVGLAAGAMALAGSSHAQEATSRKPNIIFILADDLGYGDVGCYGQKTVQTPNLDRMAAEGIRFTQAYAGSTVCAPSRCCLMTGLHTGHAWVRGNARVPLRPEDTTVAEVLKGAGYSTALIGKWGLGEPDTTGIPNRKGFDYFYGYLNQGHAHNFYPEYLWRNEEKVKLEGNVEGEPGVSRERAQYSHDLFTKEALSWLGAQKADQPFFLYLAYTIPHANNERGRAEGDGMEVPDYGPYADRDWPSAHKGRAAMIWRMDRDIGTLFQKLKDLGLDEDTIVFFSSDNGPHQEGGTNPEYFDSNGQFRGIKRDLYDGGVRVPAIVRAPGHVQPGQTSDHVWAFWDFLPTAAELAGTGVPQGLDGLSIAPTLLGQADRQAAHDYLYWEFHEGGFLQGVRMGDWKAIRRGLSGPVELYDLKTDPEECRGLAAERPDLVTTAQGLLDKARTENPNWPIRDVKPSM